MNNFAENLIAFSIRYNEYLCHSIIRDGRYVNQYQFTSEEVVDYIIDHTRSNCIDGPFKLDYYRDIHHLSSHILARIVIRDNVINHHILVFIKNPSEVLVGQSIRGVLAFNVKIMTLMELCDNIIHVFDNCNLSKLSGVGILLDNPTIDVYYHIVDDGIGLELPIFRYSDDVILNKLREEYLEVIDNTNIPYPIFGNLITEFDNAVSLRVHYQRNALYQ